MSGTELYYDGVNYAKLTVRELQDASIGVSKAFERNVLDTVDGKQTTEAFIANMSRIDGMNRTISDAFEYALDRVLE
ncbi:hypothetical protein [Erwinia phage vB_Ea277G]|jgi:hypothetical protein|nr:hypothetical protein [Erwinia phage vB_Ea277G]